MVKLNDISLKITGLNNVQFTVTGELQNMSVWVHTGIKCVVLKHFLLNLKLLVCVLYDREDNNTEETPEQ